MSDKTNVLRPAAPLDTIKMANRIRRHAVEMTSFGRSSHVGSILSMADIVAVLYGEILQVDPSQPKHPERDRFILSKGHAGAGVYSALAERGFFDTKLLKQHYQNGSVFSGHVSHKGIPGVELSTGSLGHGLSVGTGMALSARLRGSTFNVDVVLSDGECDEGSNWEAILFAAHHKLGNLTATVDYNKIQSLKSVAETLGLEPFTDKWESFGWDVHQVDGHDHKEMKAAYAEARSKKNQPSVLIANTIKGKGVSFMEHQVLWHYRTPQGDEFEAAMSELEDASDA